MYVLVMASQKGGSGKTTLSGHLAVEADRAGLGPIALIDTDPQGSLAHWWNARNAETPYFARVGALDLGEALENLRRSGVRLAVIDTPPAITGSISQVVAHADLVIVPTRPSPHDLRAVGATVDIAERHNKPLIFVVNAANPRARITGEAAVALSQHGTVAPVTIHHRVDFAASMIDGRTVGEVVPKSQSTKEISDLWLYVQDRLSRMTHDPKMLPQSRTDHLAVSSLSGISNDYSASNDFSDGGDGEDGGLRQDDWVPPPPPPPPPASGYAGPERRSGIDRRAHFGNTPAGVTERRTLPFGRRSTDRPI